MSKGPLSQKRKKIQNQIEDCESKLKEEASEPQKGFV